MPEIFRGVRDTYDGHRRQFLLIWVAAFLFLTVGAATWPFYFIVGLNTGLKPDQVNNALVLSIIASIAGSFLTTVVGSRRGRRLPLAIGMALAPIGMILTFLGTSPASYLIGINLTMFASYFVVPYFAGIAASQDPTGRAVALVGVAGPEFRWSVTPVLGDTLPTIQP